MNLRPRGASAADWISRYFAPLLIALTVLSAIAWWLFLSGGGLADGRATRETVERQGFTDVELGERAWFRCTDDDAYGRAFTATNVVGQRVSGVVCCGLFVKACTIRW